VVRNGPGHPSTKKSWSHVSWEMVPTPIQISTPIHRFIDPVDRSRSISTVNANSPAGEYGRYRRSMPIHLRRITVDRRSSIKTRDNFVVYFINLNDTCEKLLKFQWEYLQKWELAAVRKREGIGTPRWLVFYTGGAFGGKLWLPVRCPSSWDVYSFRTSVRISGPCPADKVCGVRGGSWHEQKRTYLYPLSSYKQEHDTPFE